MAAEQAGEGQPEVTPHLDDVTSAAKSAWDEVMNKPAEAPVDDKPAETVTDKPAETKTDDRPRDEQGRFAPKTEAEPKVEATTNKPLEAKPATAEKPVEARLALEQPQPDAKPAAVAPPTSWSIKSKADWDKIPPHMRDDIAKREAEVSQGFAGYQGLKPFVEAVRQRGQDPGQVIQSFMGIEQQLRTDPRAGFLNIANNLGLTQHQAAQFFAGIANDLGYAPSNGQVAPTNQNGFGGSPDQTGADPSALRQVLDPMVSPLMQRLQQLEQHLNQQTEAQKSQRLQSASAVIEKFRQDPKNRYYDNLEADIGRLLEGGAVERTGDLAADLAAAYEAAAWKNPETRALLIKEQAEKSTADQARIAKEAADKARQASRSVTGSPSPGSGAPASKRDPKLSYDEDLQNDVMDAVRSVAARA